MADTDKYNDMVSESVAMTYGMSDHLLRSGLLTQIQVLTPQDKRCLISYISQELADDEDDPWDTSECDLPPYTLEELKARLEESHQQYLRGEYVTAEESDRMLREEFPWLE